MSPAPTAAVNDLTYFHVYGCVLPATSAVFLLLAPKAPDVDIQPDFQGPAQISLQKGLL